VSEKKKTQVLFVLRFLPSRRFQVEHVRFGVPAVGIWFQILSIVAWDEWAIFAKESAQRAAAL
jgi:hypothetical protein